MSKAQLIIVPAPGVGHLVSAIEFVNTLLRHDPHLLVSLVLIQLPFGPSVDEFVTSLDHSHPNITLIYVPKAESPPLQLAQRSLEAYALAYIDAHKPLVHSIVRDSCGSVPVVGLVLDFFCVSYTDIGNEFDIPSFIFSPAGMGFVNLMLYLSSRHERVGKEFSVSDHHESISGFFNHVPTRVLPEAVFNTEGGYDSYIKMSKGFKDVKGVIVNTFIELESYAIESCKTGTYPKVYTVGPILNLKGLPNPEMDRNEWDKVMEWLDVQPESSVVFLCFGSMGQFKADQLKEIALGLEQSGYRFAWSIRSNTGNPKQMLPEWFLERVKGKGVVCGWAPQTEVLGHKAIGGFVSHCGWNSILESLWHGVPIATLPMYAEQQLNAFNLVKELGLVVELKMDYRSNGQIGREEVEKGVRSVMETGTEVRKKVGEMSKIARLVQLEGGSSFKSLSEFISDGRKGSNYYRTENF